VIRISGDDNPVKSLLVDRTELVLDLARNYQGFLLIDKTDLVPILPIRLSELSTRERILLELGVVYMCYAGGLREHPSLAREHLSSRCSVADSGLRGRISELRKEGLIITTDNGDEITVEGIIELRKLLDKLQKSHESKEL
jgi:hypothetical protein